MGGGLSTSDIRIKIEANKDVPNTLQIESTEALKPPINHNKINN